MKSLTKRRIAVVEIYFAGFMVVLGTVLPLVWLNRHPARRQALILGFEILGAGGLALQFMVYLTKRRRLPLEYYALFALAAAVILLVLFY